MPVNVLIQGVILGSGVGQMPPLCISASPESTIADICSPASDPDGPYPKHKL